MSSRRPLLIVSGTLLLAALAGCSSTAGQMAASAAPEEPSAGHGAIAGTAEVAEPPLQLVSIDAHGAVGSLDLLDGSEVELGSIEAPRSTATDGRYVFAETDGAVAVIDSGVWTWDHVDHFHYYRSEPSILGEVPGEGPVSVSTGALSTAGATGLFFAGSGEAVLLDNAELSRGRLVETLRVQTAAPGGVIAPLGDGALLSDADGGLAFHDAAGGSVPAAPCTAPSGSITTRAGLVVGCAEGAVVARMERDEPVFETIPYPVGAAAERAMSFDARKGRPTVAAVAGDRGFWLLDVRERAWQLIETPVPLARVVASDDADGSVVALDESGRVRVYGASGEERATTAPLVEVAAGVTLSVDAQRAYLNDPAAGVVHEIAYADGARIARTLATPTVPAFFAEVGR